MRKNLLAAYRRKIERYLTAILPPSDRDPAILHRAMRYCLFSGGKRLRPILTLAVADAIGGHPDDALPAAAAIEMVHTYSLIHDDLPSMDNADTRRGKPSCHRKFNEAVAILAGDALLTIAFETIASRTKNIAAVPDLVRELSRAIGSVGMVGGQVHDITPCRTPSLARIRRINRMKTAALFAASARCGAICAGANRRSADAMDACGESIGIAFQIADDILDGEPGAYADVRGLRRSLRDAESMVERARARLGAVPGDPSPVSAVIDLIEERVSHVESSRDNQRA